MPEIWSPSRPWHWLHCGPYTRLPAAMSSCAVLARVILGQQLRGPGGAGQRDRQRDRARSRKGVLFQHVRHLVCHELSPVRITSSSRRPGKRFDRTARWQLLGT